MKKPPVSVNWSHGRPRAELSRPADGGVPPVPLSTESTPVHAPGTTKFGKGNQAYRRRMVKRKANGIATLDPARCASWLTPFVKDGQAYAAELMGRYPDPALSRLIGACCDASVMFRALLSLAAMNDKDALGESRAWLREHRACLRELAALGSLVGGACAPADPTPWLTARPVEGSST